MMPPHLLPAPNRRHGPVVKGIDPTLTYPATEATGDGPAHTVRS